MDKTSLEEFWEFALPEKITVQGGEQDSPLDLRVTRLEEGATAAVAAYLGDDDEGRKVAVFVAPMRDGLGGEIYGTMDVYTSYHAVDLAVAGIDAGDKTLASTFVDAGAEVPVGIGSNRFAECGGKIRDLSSSIERAVRDIAIVERIVHDHTASRVRERSQAPEVDMGVGR